MLGPSTVDSEIDEQILPSHQIPSHWLEQDPKQVFGKFPDSRRMQRSKSTEIHRRYAKRRKYRHSDTDLIQASRHIAAQDPAFESHQDLLQNIFPEGRYSRRSYALCEAD